MSVILNIIMPNNYGFEHNELFAFQLLDKIKNLNFQHLLNYDGSIDNSPFEFSIDARPTHIDEFVITIEKLQNNRSLLSDLSINAYNSINENFSKDKHRKEYLNLFSRKS